MQATADTSRNAVGLPIVSGRILLAVGAAHIAVGPLLSASSLLATAHAVLVTGAVLAVALRASDMVWIGAAAAYVAGSDVLWRATNAQIFWEGPKYLVAGVLVIGYVRLVQRQRLAWLPIAYFAVLVPSTLVTLAAAGVGSARELISFNLSGPLSLAVSTLVFLQLRARLSELRLILACYVLPMLSLASVILIRLRSVELQFGTESSPEASGGFGPNQVSTVLGLAALVCLLLVIQNVGTVERLLYGAAGLWFLGHAALTFSRGGVFGFAISGAITLVVWALVSGRPSGTMVLALLVLIALALFPVLNAYTGGTLSSRLHDTDRTGRDELVQSDLSYFSANLVAGVGPGGLDERGKIAHTEFTRLLAEHGLMGLLAAMLLLMMAVVSFLQQTNPSGRVITLALLTFTVLSMTNASMRTASTGFFFGLAALRVGTWREEREGFRPATSRRDPRALSSGPQLSPPVPTL